MSDKHFKIKIADSVIEMISLYDCVHEFCIDYITDEKADITIRTDVNDIYNERIRDENGASSGRIPEDYPDSYLEVLACYRKIAEYMLDRKTLLMHGSAIAIDGEGILFAAKSGTGKSTHAKIWKEHFKDRVQIINDDKPLLKILDNKVLVCGTPWSGKKGLNTPVNVPLRTIYKLERTISSDEYTSEPQDANAVFELSKKEKWQFIASQAYKSENPAKLTYSMLLIDKILQLVPVKRLVCNMSDDAALTAYKGVFGDNIS